MKTHEFMIYFTDGFIDVIYAITMHQAVILSMSGRIHKGLNLDVDYIKTETGQKYELLHSLAFAKK